MNDPTETDLGELTEGERAELEADRAGQAPGAEAAAVAESAPEGDAAAVAAVEAAAAEPATADNDGLTAMARAAESLARAADSLTAQQRQPDPLPQQETPRARDFDAERAALKSRYVAGELDEDAYEAARERLFEDRADARVAQQVTERMAQAQQEAADAAWKSATAAFAADPASAKVFEDPSRVATLNALLPVLARENPAGSYADWLAAARDRTLAAYGIATAVAAAATPDPAAAAAAIAQSSQERADVAGKPPRSVATAPAAGSAIQTGPDSTLDGLDISSLEDTLARMPADKIDQYLAGAPGGLRDNPRAM